MAVSVRVESIERDVSLMLNEAFSPEEQSKVFAAFARSELVDAQRRNKNVLGTVPEHTTSVDGIRGASEDRVRPNGVIIYEFDLVVSLFAWIDQQLQMRSPVRLGKYRKSHRLYADGVEVDPLRPPQNAAEYVFLSLAPYARKIEGTGGKPPQSKQAPDGVYQVVAQSARGRFGNQARIRFGYRSATGGALSEWSTSGSAIAHAHRHGRRSNPQVWLTRQPAIIITLR